MSEQSEIARTAALYQRHLRDAAASMEQWTQALRLAADLLDAQEEPDIDLAVRPALTALGSIARTYDEALDHTLLLAEFIHVSQREIADRAGISHPTVSRRIKRLIAEHATDED